MVSKRSKNGDSAPQVTGANRIPQKGDQSFKTFLWNPKTNAVLGRTGESWAKIGLFYVVFYLFLAGFFSIMMAVFLTTIDDKLPKYSSQSGSLLRNPSLGFRPRSSFMWERRHRYLINVNESHISYSLASDIEKFLEPYLLAASGANTSLYRNCNLDERYSTILHDSYLEEEPTKRKPCLYNVTEALARLSGPPCNSENHWGWFSDSPCLFFKLNKMIDFYPEPSFSEDIPVEVKNQINDTYGDLDEKLKENMLVWCESETPGVKLVQPFPFLPFTFFPFLNQPNYLSPLVVVRADTVLDIESKLKCKAFARNIRDKVKDRAMGVAYFSFHTYTIEGELRGKEEKAKQE